MLPNELPAEEKAKKESNRNRLLILFLFLFLTYEFASLVFQNIHLSNLTSRVEVSEGIMHDTNIRILQVNKVVTDHVLDKWAHDQLQSAFTTSAENLEVEELKINQLSQFPFAHKANIAKHVYLRHTGEWIIFLRRVSSCPTFTCMTKEWEKNIPVEATYQNAHASLAKAVPFFDFLSNKSRIEKIFASKY